MNQDDINRIGDIVTAVYNRRVLENKFKGGRSLYAKCADKNAPNKTYYLPIDIGLDINPFNAQTYKEKNVYLMQSTQDAYRPISNDIEEVWANYVGEFGDSFHPVVKDYLKKKNGGWHKMGESQIRNLLYDYNDKFKAFQIVDDNYWPLYVCKSLIYILSYFELAPLNWSDFYHIKNADSKEKLGAKESRSKFFNRLSTDFKSIIKAIEDKKVKERLAKIADYEIILIHDEYGKELAKEIVTEYEKIYKGYTAIVPYSIEHGRIPKSINFPHCLGICVLLTENLDEITLTSISESKFFSYLMHISEEYQKIPIVIADMDISAFEIKEKYENVFGDLIPKNRALNEVVIDIYRKSVFRTGTFYKQLKKREQEVLGLQRKINIGILAASLVILSLVCILGIKLSDNRDYRKNHSNEIFIIDKLQPELANPELFSPFYPQIIKSIAVIPNRAKGPTKPLHFYDIETRNRLSFDLGDFDHLYEEGWRSTSNIMPINPESDTVLVVLDENKGPILAKLDVKNRKIDIIHNFEISELTNRAKGDAVDISKDGTKAVITFYQSNQIAIISIDSLKVEMVHELKAKDSNQLLNPSGVSFVYSSQEASFPLGVLVGFNIRDDSLAKLRYISMDGRQEIDVYGSEKYAYITDVKIFGEYFIATSDKGIILHGKVSKPSTLNRRDYKILERFYHSGGTPCDITINPSQEMAIVTHQQHSKIDLLKLDPSEGKIISITEFDFKDKIQAADGERYFYARGTAVDWVSGRVFVADDEGSRVFVFDLPEITN